VSKDEIIKDTRTADVESAVRKRGGGEMKDSLQVRIKEYLFLSSGLLRTEGGIVGISGQQRVKNLFDLVRVRATRRCQASAGGKKSLARASIVWENSWGAKVSS